MWKYVSRRMRDTFERSANQFEKRGSAGVVNAPASPDDKNRGPQCPWFRPRRCWKPCRNKNTNTTHNKWNFEYINKNWGGAITWTSALVLGWYTSQLLHLKYKYNTKKVHERCISINSILKSLQPYVASVNKDAICINSAPRIEKIINDFSPSIHLISNDQHGMRKEDDTGSSRKTNSNTSNSDLGDVLNSIENKLGLAAIENGQHQDGLKLLRSAAHRHYAPALYNLALCYETGLGVTANEKTAMELFKSAAALEHPAALYNLSVYYAQGRGGLSCDFEMANRLLRLAAMKGEKDAIKALKELDLGDEEPSHQNKVEPWPFSHNFSESKDVVPLQISLFANNASYLKTSACEAAVY